MGRDAVEDRGVIFRSELSAKVMAGEKTVTRRLCSPNPRSPWWRERCRYRVGQRFAVQRGRGKQGKAIGYARVVSVHKERLSDAFKPGRVRIEAMREGFPNGTAFRAAFADINGKVHGSTYVWRIEFEVIG
jgi:hypothetical protein